MRLSPLIQLSYSLQQYISSQNAQIVRRQGTVPSEQLAVVAYFATDIFVPNRIRCQRICPLKTVVLAQMAILLPEFADLNESERHFLLMPYMHSESVYIHKQAVELFGRYPHRNAILGRASTPEELAFLAEPNSSF